MGAAWQGADAVLLDDPLVLFSLAATGTKEESGWEDQGCCCEQPVQARMGCRAIGC